MPVIQKQMTAGRFSDGLIFIGTYGHRPQVFTPKQQPTAGRYSDGLLFIGTCGHRPQVFTPKNK